MEGVTGLDQGSSNRPDERVVHQLEAIEPWLLGAVFGIVGLTSILWLIPPLRVFAPSGWSAMVPDTTVGIGLATVGLALSAERRTPRQLRSSRLIAAVVLALGLEVLAERSLGSAQGLEAWFPARLADGLDLRSALQTGLLIAATGLCLLLIREYKTWRALLADGCALLLVGLVMVFGAANLYGASALAGPDVGKLSSPQALVCFSGLTFVIAARRARGGSALAALVNVGIGSQIVRKVLPILVLTPFVCFGAVAFFVDLPQASSADAFAIAAALESFLVLCLTVWMGQRINRMERELRDLSLIDELTGINNRRGFYLLAHQVVRDAERSGANLAVFFFDLDGLKRVNDTAGHEEGSRLIRDFAAALKENFRANDVIGRVGGDEFAVISSGAFGRCADVLARLERRVAERNRAQPQAVAVEFSAGCAERGPDSTANLEALIARADAMMYRNKQAKRAESPQSTAKAGA